jgi:NAD(P)-dependent dehydrogenase (short-subunit alcohol dehydrogenase family)
MPTAVVTGGSEGLGRAITRALHELGWTVVTDARNEKALVALAEELGSGRLVAVPGDVSEESHRRALVAAAAAAGDLQLLVNNASTLGPTPMPRLERAALDDWRAAFETNVVAPLALVQLALAHLVPGRGRILNITSDAAVEAYEGWGVYGASKAALEQLSKVLAAEHEDLDVYWVDPGDMRTRMQHDAFPGEDISDRPPPEDSVPGLLALILGEYPSGRYRAADIAAASGRREEGR